MNFSMNILFLLLSLGLAVSLGMFSQKSNAVQHGQNKPYPHGRVNFTVQNTKYPDCAKNVTYQHILKMQNNLGMDEALLVLVAEKAPHTLMFYANWDVCYKCPLINFTRIDAHTNATCVISTSFALHMEFVSVESNHTLFSFKEKMAEYGTYYVWFENSMNLTYNFFCNDQPGDSNTPIYVAIGIFGGLIILWIILKVLFRRGYLYRVAVCMPYERLINTDLGRPTEAVMNNTEVEEPPKAPPKKQRLKSLDTFRGISLVIMIFVNYKGGGYWFFHHSTWNGLTVADLVFPWFTFIMGTSIALAFRSMVTRGAGKKELAWKVLKRTIILFTIGLMISNDGSKGFVDVKKLRIPGVLQRLALTYLAVAMTEVFFAGKSVPTEKGQCRYWYIRDIVPFWPEWVISLSFLTVHICLTFLLPVPGCPTGYLGPGGLHDYPKYENCTGGAAGYIDRKVLSSDHIYGHPTCMTYYQTTQSYDPEGILGTLTSIFMCFLGLQAGKILVIYSIPLQRINRWIVWGAICGVIAGGLCKFSQNEGVIPVNKNFWSVSFILGLSSMAFFLLIVCYILVDVLKIWSGAPFFYPGMNSIVVYVCHEVFHQYFPVQFSVRNTHAAQLAMNLYGTALWTIMAAVLYYKGIFIAI